MKEIPEDIQRLLKQVLDHFDQEDRSVRERQIRMWRQLKLYWDSFHNIYWSEVAHDWRIPETSRENNEQSYYDKPINVYRAYLESIIAALSVTVPSIKCFPDDADNPLDLSTAKAGDRISELVYKHNDSILLWIHALYVYCTEGLIAAYSYTKEDEKYGTYEEKEYEDTEEEAYLCPECQTQLADEMFTANEQAEFGPDDDDVAINDTINQLGPICPECGAMLDPELQKSSFIVTRLVGITNKPKSRQCIEVYGGLYVKIPNYAMKQEDIPYLIFSYETHYANVIERYPHLRGKLKGSTGLNSTSGVYDPYEQWGRLSPQYHGEYPVNTVTVRNCWFRPSAFNVLNEDDAEKLKKNFPNGAKVIFANENFAHAENEDLDDCWTLTKNPLSDYLHHDPIGLLLVSVQDITNDLVSLILQTVEHGITQTFADPNVLNFDQYSQMEITPGTITPAKPKTGKSLQESFYEIKTSSLSGEVLPFSEMVQSMGQLVSGALPSLFGGVQSGGSKTASQYAMSRSQALQRLQTPWKMLSIWWKTIFGKVIPAYIKEVKDDERFVQQDEVGNFINVFIRRAELQGKIGSIELEANENLPITWSQKKDVIMQLLQAGNPVIMEAMLSPENLPFISEALGLTEFVIPGEEDRQKQYEEIQALVNSEPIVMPPDPMMEQAAMMGDIQAQQMLMQGPQEIPSVEVDPDVDNHQIEAEICRHWLVSEAGRLAKTENPLGYKNVLLHMKAHMQIVMQQMMMQAQQAQPPTEGAPAEKKEEPNPQGRNQQAATKAPIGEESNV